MQCQRGRGSLGQLWDFFSSDSINFEIKINTTRTLIFSKLSYGQDIIGLTETDKKMVESLLSKSLRAALNQPRRSKTSALQLLIGQPSIESQFQARRLNSFLQSEVQDVDRWNKADLTGNVWRKDLIKARRAREHTSVTEKEWTECITNYSEKGTRKVTRKIFKEESRLLLTRDVQGSHSASLLRVFDSFCFFPLLRKAGKPYVNFITWLTASTDLYGDKTESERKEQQESCRLCGEIPETRQHLLTECPVTVHLIISFIERLRHISQEKFMEYTSLSESDRWLWIVGAGVIPLPETRRTERIVPLTSIFRLGTSVQTGFNRKDPLSADSAFYEFKEIERGLDPDDIVMFTDGSFKNGASGSAVALYRNREIIHKLSKPTGDMSIAYAELYAIYIAVKWLRQSGRFKANNIHFFVDNIFVRDALCRNSIPKRFFFLIQDIKHTAKCVEFTREFYIHWIPSHIDRLTLGRFSIQGNQEADRLADLARKQAYEELNRNQSIPGHETIRDRILDESVDLIWKISELLVIKGNVSDGPSSDDISPSANANQFVACDEL